jgi:hypothetical protein
MKMMTHPRLYRLLALFLSGTLASTEAQTLLWSDNFDLGTDTTNFDGSSLTGRLSGPLGTAPDCVARSSGTQQSITSNQLDLRGGRIRFQSSASGPRYDWSGTAAGSSAATIAAAADIIAAGGMRISFDYVPTNNTSTNWVNVSVGMEASFDGQAITDGGTDYGVLLRNNGGTERFDNGFNKGPGASFPATTTSRHAEYLYAFSSFADGTEVRSRVIVDGVQVAADTFFLDNNANEFYFVVEVGEVGTLVDNLTVSTAPLIYNFALTGNSFISGIDAGDPIGTLSSETFAKGPESSAYTFVSGTGDEDNAKFTISGDQILAGTYDFTQDAHGTQYFVRVQGTGSVTGGTQQKELVLTLIKDDDADDLIDTWELTFADELTDLNGLGTGTGPGAGTGDFDGDGISDYQEFQYSLSTYPGINPVLADTDDDTINDGDEIAGAGSRPPTNPLIADTDLDGLDDGVESNTGTFVSATDTGTNPTLVDTDLDGSRDSFEVEKNSNPTDVASRPALPPAFGIFALTDDASSGLSTNITYTHKISGGGAATVNGVTLEELNPALTPTNFTWTVSAGAPAEINPINNSTWVPATGNVTGPGLLDMLGGFTYNTTGNPGGFQTYTLSGLTVGETYKLKIFIRPWDNVGASRRPIDFEFINGATIDIPFGSLVTDRPGVVLNNGNDHSAYYVCYTYVAEATDLMIKATVPIGSLPASGSFHLYGLTNEVIPEVSTDLLVTGTSRDASNNFIINYKGAASTTYNVTKSPDLLTPFGPLTIPLTTTTDAAGVGQAIIPATETTEAREFYRIEE